GRLALPVLLRAGAGRPGRGRGRTPGAVARPAVGRRLRRGGRRARADAVAPRPHAGGHGLRRPGARTLAYAPGGPAAAGRPARRGGAADRRRLAPSRRLAPPRRPPPAYPRAPWPSCPPRPGAAGGPAGPPG